MPSRDNSGAKSGVVPGPGRVKRKKSSPANPDQKSPKRKPPPRETMVARVDGARSKRSRPKALACLYLSGSAARGAPARWRSNERARHRSSFPRNKMPEQNLWPTRRRRRSSAGKGTGRRATLAVARQPEGKHAITVTRPEYREAPFLDLIERITPQPATRSRTRADQRAQAHVRQTQGTRRPRRERQGGLYAGGWPRVAPRSPARLDDRSRRPGPGGVFVAQEPPLPSPRESAAPAGRAASDALARRRRRGPRHRRRDRRGHTRCARRRQAFRFASRPQERRSERKRGRKGSVPPDVPACSGRSSTPQAAPSTPRRRRTAARRRRRDRPRPHVPADPTRGGGSVTC